MGHIPRQVRAGARLRRQGPPETKPQRRALTNVGGKVCVEANSAADRELLVRALDVSAGDPYVSAHVHGFHSYPARLHPRSAQSLVTGLTLAGQAVLDPFCGSGTVLVEARIAGRVVFGLDANPLAIALSSLKLRAMSPAQRRELLALAKGLPRLPTQEGFQRLDLRVAMHRAICCNSILTCFLNWMGCNGVSSRLRTHCANPR